MRIHTLRPREGPADLSPELLDPTPDALVAVPAGIIFARHPLCEVASATTANVVDGRRLFLADTLTCELLVEAEDGAFGATAHVASATAAARVDRAGHGLGVHGTALGAGSRACGGVNAAIVACASAATVDVVGGRDGWERLGDMVAHGDCLVGLR